MLISNPYLRGYLFSALLEGPTLLRLLVKDMTDEQADARTDPERFTLREAIAHLADWETVFRERFERVVSEDSPVLPNIDEGQRAIDRDYGRTDWREQLALFESRRAENLEFLKGLKIESWARTGNRPEIGNMSLYDLVQLMPLHDSYHQKQAREYLSLG